MARGDLVFRRLASTYEKERQRYLPYTTSDAPNWAFCPKGVRRNEGWKIHVPATIRTAATTLAAIGPILEDSGQPFKGIADLTILKKMNIGLFGLSQIGKTFTIYPEDDDAAVDVAHQLRQVLHGLSAPHLHEEPSLFSEDRIFYRYGAFSGRHISGPRGGRRVDHRRMADATPYWVENPFAGYAQPKPELPKSLQRLQSLAILECLSQRGKGGVYRVSYNNSNAILKEGRRHGETSPIGVDGRTVVARELRILRRESVFATAGAPLVLATFGSRDVVYGILEDVGARTLADSLLEESPTPGLAKRYALSMVQILRTLHDEGWAWRDLKPTNLVIGRGGLRPIDFEGACRIGVRDLEPWGSPGFVPPNWTRPGAKQDCQDLFALAVTLLTILSPGTLQAVVRGTATPESLRRRATTLGESSPYSISCHLSEQIAALLDPSITPDNVTLWELQRSLARIC